MVIPVLILGGSAEASALARALVGNSRFAATLSLAGRTSAPNLPPSAWRIGGFGGAAGLAEYLRAQRIAALVDATHPFAARITANAVVAAAATGVKLLLLRRPPWREGPGDAWQHVPDMAQAAAALGRAPRRVLLTVGQQELAPFAAAPWHHYVIRSIETPPPDRLPPDAHCIAARGPFSEAAEAALLAAQRIDIIVTKNSGAAATGAKLAAARARRIPVVMVARPALPDFARGAADVVADPQAALGWLEAQYSDVRHHGALSATLRGE